MKRLSFLLYVFLLFHTTSSFGQNITFADPNFKAYLTGPFSDLYALGIDGNSRIIDYNRDGEIQLSEALQIRYLTLRDGQPADIPTITSIEGIQSFANLRILNWSYGHLTSLDVSGMINLQELICGNNSSLTNINFTGCNNLTVLDVRNNQLTTLDASGFINLAHIYAGNNLITSPNLHIDNLPNLRALVIYQNKLTSLNLSNRPFLQLINVEENNFLESLNVNGCSSLVDIYCSNTRITSLDLSDCSSIGLRLICHNNSNLSYINLKNQTTEISIDISNSIYVSAICCDEGDLGIIQAQLAANNMTETCQLSTDCSTLGNTDFINENKVSIYPNPASNVLHISNIDQKTNIKICNIDGKVIRDTFAFPDTDLNIEALENGLYFIILDNKLTLKFLKE